MVNDSNVATKIQFVAPKTKIYKFFETLFEKTIIFQVVKMDGSLLIYVNDAHSPNCYNLDMAMNTRFSSTPHTTTLLGLMAEHPGSSVASRLSKKLKKTVFLSLNVDDSKFMVPLVEKRLIQEINQHPDNF